MKKESEADTLYKICKEAKVNGRLTGKHLKKLYDVFNKRLTKAFEALKENRIKKYIFKPSGKKVWIVVGKERDYLIMPEADFCSCEDFYFRVLNKEVHLCYHLIAQKISTLLKSYETIEEQDQLYDTLMAEWERN